MNRKGREERKDNGACKTQGGPGGQDRAVEPQHRRDHLPQDRARYNRLTRRHMPKTMKLTGNTSEMLRHYVGNRKKGDIFINDRTGKRLTLRHFEKMIDKWARLLNIQKLQSIKPSGREYHLITLMGLREAGERRLLGHYEFLPAWKASRLTVNEVLAYE